MKNLMIEAKELRELDIQQGNKPQHMSIYLVAAKINNEEKEIEVEIKHRGKKSWVARLNPNPKMGKGWVSCEYFNDCYTKNLSTIVYKIKARNGQKFRAKENGRVYDFVVENGKVVWE